VLKGVLIFHALLNNCTMIINIIFALIIIQLPSFIFSFLIVRWNLKKLGFQNIDVHDKMFRIPFSFVYPSLVTLFIIVYICLAYIFSFF